MIWGVARLLAFFGACAVAAWGIHLAVGVSTIGVKAVSLELDEAYRQRGAAGMALAIATAGMAPRDAIDRDEFEGTVVKVDGSMIVDGGIDTLEVPNGPLSSDRDVGDEVAVEGHQLGTEIYATSIDEAGPAADREELAMDAFESYQDAGESLDLLVDLAGGEQPDREADLAAQAAGELRVAANRLQVLAMSQDDVESMIERIEEATFAEGNNE